jgi:hypothetical protein
MNNLGKISMKEIKFFLATLILISFLTSEELSAQSPFAPWAKLSSDAPKEISARKYPVPSKDEVGIPAYPGAYISSVSAPKQDTIRYEQEVMAFVNLVTSDPVSSVISFYKKILTKDKGWNYSEEYKTFVKGQTVNALTGFVPTVKIRDERGDNFDLGYVDPNYKKNLKTRIEVTYKPSK